MSAKGHQHVDVVGAVSSGHGHESVTTASQTDLSGEVSPVRQLSTIHTC